jgi:lysozyme
MREINIAGLSLIKQFEGLRLQAYQDVVGIWTIGYGHTGPEVKQGQTITQDQAEALLKKDIAGTQASLDSLCKGKGLTTNQFSAMVVLAFNIGVGAFRRSTLLKKLLAGDEKGAADEFMRWNKAGGAEVKGLTRRRSAERDLFLVGLSTLPRET